MTDTSLSFMRSLCLGEIEQDILFPFPTLAAAQRELLNEVLGSVDRLLTGQADAFRKWDQAGEIPPRFIEKMKEFGLFGLIIPESHGGMGFGNMAYARTLQQIARHDASLAVTVGAHSSIGMRGLKLFGTPEQQERFYEKLATGELIAAFCLTEPGAGSDAAATRTTAVDHDDYFLLNGSKIWITNGGIADFFTVFAKTGETEGRARLSAFIVTRDMPGVTTSGHEDKMGIRASSTTTVYFDNVRVPRENLLGPLHGGFKIAMNILNSGRSGLGGGAVGMMKRVIALATKQATERHQFGKPIAEFGLIKQKLGHMVVDCYATEAAVTMVAALSDQGYQDYSVEAASVKVFASEALWRTADEALQVAGGSGYMKEYPYEQIMRDARINRIFEGTNEVLRLFVALNALSETGQRLKDMSNVRGLFDHPIKGFGVLYDYAKRRAIMATGYKAEKTLFSKVHLTLRPQAEIFEDLTRQLGAMADRILRKHGRAIIEKQFAMRRMADVMIDLFVLACVLARVTASIETHGPDKAASEVEIAQIFAGQVKGRVLRNFRKIDDNDDEAIKHLAVEACERGGYGWDTL